MPVTHQPALLARIVEVETRPDGGGAVMATSPQIPALALRAADEAALYAALPRAIRDSLMSEEPCVALPVGRDGGAAGTWVAIPDELVRRSLAA